MSEDKRYIFTFGLGTDKANKCVLVYGKDAKESREKMLAKYGTEWAFQYSYEEWETNNKKGLWKPEEIIGEIE